MSLQGPFRSRIVALVLLGLGVLVAGACSKKDPTLHFETHDFAKGLDGCKPQTEACTYLKFQYPLFSQGSKQVAQDLNQKIQAFLLASTGQKKSPSKDLENFANDFFSEYQKAKKDYPQIPGAWFLERTVKVDLDAPDVLAEQTTDSEFTGGAHPNSETEFINYKPNDGSRIVLADLFVPDYLPKLTAIAEKNFREKQQIPEGQNLQEAGYFFENGVFKLNQNFSIGTRDLTFLFNPYEAGPYAMGPIQFSIPYDQLKDILKPDGIIAGVQKNPGKKG